MNAIEYQLINEELELVFAFIYAGDNVDQMLGHIEIDEAHNLVSGPRYVHHREQQRQAWNIYCNRELIAVAQSRPHPILYVEETSYKKFLEKAISKYSEVRVDEL